MRFSSFSLCAALLLSACSGSDEATSFTTLDAKFNDINDRALAEETFTPSTMPTTGTASYAGAVEYFDSDGSVGMVSAVNMKADFAKNTMGGSLSNFVLSNNMHLSGALALSNGTISDVDYGADVSGHLTAKSTRMDMTGTVNGSFYREDASLIAVNVELADQNGATVSGFGAAEK